MLASWASQRDDVATLLIRHMHVGVAFLSWVVKSLKVEAFVTDKRSVRREYLGGVILW